MQDDGTTYRNLLIAAAEVRYLAGQEIEGQARWKKLILAKAIERLAIDIAPPEQVNNAPQREQTLRLVHTRPDY